MPDIEILENGNVKITIPIALRSCAGRKRIVAPESPVAIADPLVLNFARAFRWQELIDQGAFANVHELANAIGKDYGYVARVIRLTLLAPEIVHAALTGTMPNGVGVEDLRSSMPDLWEEQKKAIGMQ